MITQEKRTFNQERLYEEVRGQIGESRLAEMNALRKMQMRPKFLRQLATGRLKDANAALTFTHFVGRPFEDFIDGPALVDDRLRTICVLEEYLAANPELTPERSVMMAALDQLKREDS
jgi:hypothetical protein